MTLRIIDAELQLDAAVAALEAALTRWAGAAHDVWRKNGRDGVEAEGASFAQREDVYLFLENTKRDVLIGAALTENDRDLLRVEIVRKAPARHKKRFAFAEDDGDGKTYLLIAAEELSRQNIRDAFRRLAGALSVKRATISERDYVLIGPLSEPRAADALLSLAGLHPDFERHVERLGELAAQSDAREEAALYKVSRQVTRQHRAHAKVVSAIFERLHAFGFHIDDAENGPYRADFVMSRGADTLVFEIRADAALEDLLRAIGQLALVAPKPAGLARVLVLPAPREKLGAALEPFHPAFEELGLSVLIYDFKEREASFFIAHGDDSLSQDVRTLFN